MVGYSLKDLLVLQGFLRKTTGPSSLAPYFLFAKETTFNPAFLFTSIYLSGPKRCHLLNFIYFGALHANFPLRKTRTSCFVLLIHTTHNQFPSSQDSSISVLIRKVSRVYINMTIYAVQAWGIYETNFFLPAQFIPGVNSFLFICLFIFV